MLTGICWLLYLVSPSLAQFRADQVTSLRSIVQDEFLSRSSLALAPSNPEDNFQKSIKVLSTYLQQRAGTDLSCVPDFFQGQPALNETIKALAPLVTQPLALMAGTCPLNASGITWPRPPPQNRNSLYQNVTWEAKFTALLAGNKSFQGTAGLNVAGTPRSGFGLEIQQRPLSQSYSLGMQWLFRRSIEGFTFTVAVSSPTLQGIGITDIHLIYSHPNWLCLSRCSITTCDADDKQSTNPLSQGNYTAFLKGIILQGFGLTFRRFNTTIPTLQPIIDGIPASVTALLSSTVKSYLQQVQNQLKAQPYGSVTGNISVAIGDVVNIWNNVTQYQSIQSPNCSGCGAILNNTFVMGPSSNLSAFEGMMTKSYIETPLRIGKDQNLTSAVEGQALLGVNSTCNSTKVSLLPANVSLGALAYIVKDSFTPFFINGSLVTLGSAAALSLQRATMEVSVTISDATLTARGGVPWLPAGARDGTNALLLVASAVNISSLQFTVSAKFQNEFLLVVNLSAAPFTDPGRLIQVIALDGTGLTATMVLRFSAAQNQVSQDIRSTVPLAICVANCTSTLGQRQLLYFSGDGRVESKNLVGTLYSRNDWQRALGFDFLQVSAMNLTLQWPLTLSRPTAAQWTGALCLGTVQRCTAGGFPSIQGVAFMGIDELNAAGNYFIGALDSFTFGTLAAVTVPGASLTVPVLRDMSVIPKLASAGASCSGDPTLANVLTSGCYVSLVAPSFDSRAPMPSSLQVEGQLVLPTVTFNATINVTRDGLQIKGAIPLWCLNITGECVMHFGYALDACHATGASNFTLSLSANAQSADVSTTGAMDIPMLMGCGPVAVQLQNDNTFRYSGPFSLFNGTWMPNVNISWPASGTSFLVEMGSIAFVNNIPVLSDVRYYFDGSSAYSNDFVTLKATWHVLNFTVPDTEIVFSDTAISFHFQTDNLQSIGSVLQGSQYEVTGSGDISLTGHLEDSAFQVLITWMIEGTLNALIQETIINQALQLAALLNNITAKIDSLFDQVQVIFNTTLLPIRPTLAWGLTNVSGFLSSSFEAELNNYGKTYMPEPFIVLLGNGGNATLTGSTNEYGCALYQYNYSVCVDSVGGYASCTVRSYGPYPRSSCMVPRIGAMSLVKGLQAAMILREGELQVAKQNSPALVAIAQIVGALPSDGSNLSLSDVIPYVPLQATLSIQKGQLGSRRLMQDAGFATLDICPKKTATPTPTATATATATSPKPKTVRSKFAVQETVPALPLDLYSTFTCSLNVSDTVGFQSSLQSGASTSVVQISDQATQDEKKGDNLQPYMRNYTSPILSPAANIELPCTTTNFSVTPPTLTVDEACAAGAGVQVVGTSVKAGAQCGDIILTLKWQGQGNATCTQSSNVVEQQVTVLGVRKLSFDSFPNNVTILNVEPAQANATGIPTGSVICGISVSITFSDTPIQLPLGKWLINRTWSIAPRDANCPNSSDNDQYRRNLTYTQVQVITVLDVTPPAFNETPPAVVQLGLNVSPNATNTGVPKAVDPINLDLLTRGVNRSNVTLTYNDTIIQQSLSGDDDKYLVTVYQRKWQAADSAGNRAFFNQTVYATTTRPKGGKS